MCSDNQNNNNNMNTGRRNRGKKVLQGEISKSF